ncbi:uncharacterized protein MELLADRAFT_94155 [Melampsora larici-populina 98AG31]|uniref:Uncharacterized protein n=1 Tax=Melampsora larici-populina (strain 98AG31 / pathotype 3-4-7) TaxID=747676 RepID=F4S6P0_MELLP|nr:uncharacterized protein MELLADRAFT_94155 [Melampsora larici-populina 98AG31]EGF99722.1 hypothetical protein MELLADRAFT_94155 [Melampsora larici-populina 98AG31]
MQTNQSLNNFFETPFGGTPGQGDGMTSSGISLFGMNNHAQLRNVIASGFEEPARGQHDNHSSRRSLSQVGPGMTDPGDARFLSGTRGQDGRSISPHARSSQSNPNRFTSRSSFQSLNGQGGPQGPLNDYDGFNAHLETQIDDGVYANPLPSATRKTFDAMSKQAGLDSVTHAFAMQHAEVFGETNCRLSQVIVQGRLLMDVTNLRSQVTTLTEQMATVTEILRGLAEAPASAAIERPASRGSSEETGWVASAHLYDVMNPLALSLLISPQLTAYTAVKNRQEGILPNSLFNVIKVSTIFGSFGS